MKCAALTRFPVIVLLAMALPACQQADQTAPAQQESTPAGPDAKPGLSASGGVLLLPAVKGRPGAAYLTLSNDSENPAELAAVHIEGAIRSEMHETKGGTMAKLTSLAVPPGANVTFARGGKHVMAFELPEELKPGRTTEMTLSFADGDKLSVPLSVEAIGGSGGAVEHIDHGEGL